MTAAAERQTDKEIEMNTNSAEFQMTIDQNGTVDENDFNSACAICRNIGAKKIFVNGREVKMAINQQNGRMLLEFVNPNFDITSLFEN